MRPPPISVDTHARRSHNPIITRPSTPTAMVTAPSLDDFLDQVADEFALVCRECDGPAVLEVRGRSFYEPGYIRLVCPVCDSGVEFINL